MANGILKEIEREYEILRTANEEKARRNYYAAMADKEFSEIEKSIKALNFAIAKAEQFELDENKTLRLKKEKEVLTDKRSARLKILGLAEKDVAVQYNCKICKDTGFINGIPCRCFKEKWKIHSFAALGIAPTPTLTFADDTAAKPVMTEKLYITAKKYVENFPNGKTHNFLFIGKTGSGKTHLASIMAGELAKKGFNCIFLTATELNQLFLKMHVTNFNERPDYMGILLGCDFLVIDDLGTENVYKNVTCECFFTLISERLAKHKHTVITTNFTPDEIMEKYNERFFSRVTEKKTTAVITFADVNFREQK